MERKRLAILGAAAGALFVLLLLDVVFHGFAARLDERWGPRLVSPAGPLYAGSVVLNVVGGTAMVAAIVAATSAVLAWRGERIAAARFATLCVLSFIVMEGLKFVIARPRPSYGLVAQVTDSFPSGHATFGAIFAVSLAWLVAHRVRGKTLVAAYVGFALLYALAMAASRVALGVHYPSDVAGGLLLGTSLACFGIAAPFPEKIKRRLQR